MNEGGFVLEDRILCSDGACIGVIGSNGCCKVCGKTHSGDEPLPKLEEEESQACDASIDNEFEVQPEMDGETDAVYDPSERVCCPDDMCIGIIGEDGKCGICRKDLC